MILNVITLVLVLAIIFMHSVFGFFSGMINAFCTIVSVAVALGFYEALNGLLTAQFGQLSPAYVEPACLVVLFFVSVIVLRTLADNYIRGNVRLPMVLDWGGAAVCGVINAELFVGMIVLGVAMLPLRSSESAAVLGFARYQRNPDESNPDHPGLVNFERQSLWLRPDEFTVGLFNLISGGSMRGKTAFASVYPDFTEAVFFSTNTVQPQSMPAPYRDSKADGFAKGLQVDSWWEETGPVDARYRRDKPTAKQPTPDYRQLKFQLAPGKKLIVARLLLDRSAADREGRKMLHLFRPTMLRLVGKRGGAYEQYVPRIIANADGQIGGRHRVVDYDNNFSLAAGASVGIYTYFEVDEGFQPTFVEYRRHARAPMDASTKHKVAVDVQLTMADQEEEGGRGGGRTFGRVLEQHSGDNRQLPFAMQQRRLRGGMGDVAVEGNAFVSGRVFGSRARLEHAGEGVKLDQFKVPEGYRLIQVRYKPKRARTLVGDVFNFVGQLNQYYAIDNNAEQYPLAGYFAIVKRSDGEYIELFFTGDPESPLAVSYRHMLDFKDLEHNEINDQDDTIVGLLFLVKPGVTIKRVENQTHEGGDVNLKARG